jgi:hypothetical protein
MTGKSKPKNGNLRIDAPFDDALKAALEVKPAEKPKKKRSAKKRS